MTNKDDSLFDEDFGDLFKDTNEVSVEEDVEVKQAPRQEVKQAPRQEVKQAPTNELDTDIPEVGQFVPAGTKVSAVPIPRFKASATGRARASVLSKNVMVIKTHYVDGLGNFECFGGKCCELEGMPRVRYVFPIAQYEVNSKGQIISDEVQIKALSLSDDTYDALMNAVEASGRELNDVDVLITCSDETYQKLTFAADATRGASWRTFPDAAKKKIVSFYKANINKLGLGVAKKMSAETYLLKKGFVGAPAPSLPENVEDMLDE